MVSFYTDDARPIIMIAAAFMTYMLKSYGKTLDIVDCVTATALFQCTDPRDHLYSLLSVTPNCSGLEANYTLSVQEVCMRFAEATLISNQNLKVLSLAPHTTVKEAGQKPVRLALPTWVPDLTCQGIVNPMVSYTIRPRTSNPLFILLLGCLGALLCFQACYSAPKQPPMRLENTWLTLLDRALPRRRQREAQRAHFSRRPSPARQRPHRRQSRGHGALPDRRTLPHRGGGPPQ
jgi:hypothetical protein